MVAIAGAERVQSQEPGDSLGQGTGPQVEHSGLNWNLTKWASGATGRGLAYYTMDQLLIWYLT